MATGSQEDLLRRIRLLEKHVGILLPTDSGVAQQFQGALKADNNLSDVSDLFTSRANLEQDASGALISLARTGSPKADQHAHIGFNVALARSIVGQPVTSTSASPVIEAVFGDSLTGGYVSNPNQSAWPAVYEAEMARRFNSGERTLGTVAPIFAYGAGIYPNFTAWDTYKGNPITHANNPVESGGVNNNVGPNTVGAHLTSSDALVFHGYGDGVICYFTAHSSGSGLGGTAQVTIVGPGGTSNTSVSTQTGSLASNTSAVVSSIGAPGGIPGTLTVTISRTGGGTNVDLDLVLLTNGNRTSGYQQHMIGLGGTKFTDWTPGGTNTALSTNFIQYLTNVQPQFLTFCLGTNDYAFSGIMPSDLISRFNTLIAAIRACYSTWLPSIRFIFEPATTLTIGGDWANSYRDAARTACELDGNVAFVDFYELSGGWSSTSDPYSQATGDVLEIHPGEPTHYVWGLAMADHTLHATPTAANIQTRFSDIASLTLAGGGKFTIADAGSNSVGLQVWDSAADAASVANFGTVSGFPAWGFSDGTNPPDVSCIRSGAGVARLTGQWEVVDGTAGHGQVLLSYVSTLGSAVAIYKNTADTMSAALLLSSGLYLGAGGSSSVDTHIIRSGAGTLELLGATTVLDGTAAHGQVKIAAVGSGVTGVGIYDNTASTNAMTGLLTSGLFFGPNNGAFDVTLARSGTAAAQFTGSLEFVSGTVTVDDGTAAHGLIKSAVTSLGLTSVSIYANSTDAQPAMAVFQSSIQFGPGGSSSLDVNFARTGTSTATLTGALAYKPVVDTMSAVSSTIGITSVTRRLNNTSGGALTVTAAPTIADGTDGQILVVFNGSTNNVVLQDQGTLASSNLRLGATTRTLGTRDSLMLMFSSTVGDWIELAFSNVL